MELVIVYFAPIPVGHRVRVAWHEKVEEGLVPSQVRTDGRPHEPTIVDLDTGIRYETDWRTGAHRRKHRDQPYDLGEDSLEDVRVEREVEGVVRSCRVVTVRGFPELEVQTHLRLDT